MKEIYAEEHLEGRGVGVLISTADADNGPPEVVEVLVLPRLHGHMRCQLLVGKKKKHVIITSCKADT